MERGNIASWAVKVGDTIKPGDVLADIETDKAVMAWENQDDGVIAKLLAPSGAKDIAVGQAVVVIVEDAASVSAFDSYEAPGAAGGGAPSTSGTPEAAAPAAPSHAAPPPAVQANYRMGPAARLLLQSHGLSASDITSPTGPNAIITKPDVLSAVAAGVKPGVSAPAHPAPSAAASAPAAAAPAAPTSSAPRPAAPAAAAAAPATARAPAAAAPAAPSSRGAGERTHTDTPNSQIRKIIASRLVLSKATIPSLYVTAEADLGAVATLRAELAARGSKVSVNDCVLKAVAMALREVPAANSFWDEAAGAAAPYPSIDISVAVATERGLITPIVKGADGKSLAQISKAVKELVVKARENKLKPEEFQGGSFSVSNLGMFGLTHFSAIINPPQACILAVGGASQRTVLGPGGKPESRSVMTVTISADHRVYDGKLAADLLAAFVRNIESPINLLM